MGEVFSFFVYYLIPSRMPTPKSKQLDEKLLFGYHDGVTYADDIAKVGISNFVFFPVLF